MSDERLEKVQEKLADALERERTLRQAVEWYADEKNWKSGRPSHRLEEPRSPVTVDRGNRAKAALKNA